jgi:hypothetical protein
MENVMKNQFDLKEFSFENIFVDPNKSFCCDGSDGN